MSFSIGFGLDGSFDASFDATFNTSGGIAGKKPGGDKNWEYRFDNNDDYIDYPIRCYELDNPQFELDFTADLETSNGTIISQNLDSSSSLRDFQVYKTSTGLYVIMSGRLHLAVSGTTDFVGGLANYKVIFTGGEIKTYKDGVLLRTIPGSPGLTKEPTATITIGARKGSNGTSRASYFGGVIRDVKFYVGGDSTTGTLCLDTHINDGPDSTEIENLVGDNGVNHNFQNENWQPKTSVIQPKTQGFPYTFPMTF